MSFDTTKWSKAMIGGLLAGSILIGAMPAQAQHRDDDRIDAGTVIAGAVVAGGLAAVLSDDRDSRGYGRDRRHGDWQRYGGGRAAVERCVAAAEERGSRHGPRVTVSRIDDIDRVRNGYSVHGLIVADDHGRGYGDRDRRYASHRDNQGTFRCEVRFGQVQKIRLAGID